MTIGQMQMAIDFLAILAHSGYQPMCDGEEGSSVVRQQMQVGEVQAEGVGLEAAVYWGKIGRDLLQSNHIDEV